jgi:heparin/heparan-sulfate lyase
VFIDDNDGEQRRPKTDLMVRHHETIVPECDMGDVVAFETNPQYVYVCGDGTKAYNWLGDGEYTYSVGRQRRTYTPQLESFTRQYVYLLPDTFVVYDRTVAANPKARKVWQLHTWEEPTVEGTVCTAGQGKGKLTCVTLLPESPVIKKEFQQLIGAQETKTDFWRITVERASPAKAEQFLHVIHVGEAEGYQAPEVRKISGNGTVGAEVQADGMTYTVTFGTAGPVGGHVTVKKGNQALVDNDLTTEVQPQSGYAEAR